MRRGINRAYCPSCPAAQHRRLCSFGLLTTTGTASTSHNLLALRRCTIKLSRLRSLWHIVRLLHFKVLRLLLLLLKRRM